MNAIVNISGTDVQKIEYRGEPVVTFAMIDKVHGRVEGTAGRVFRENRTRFEIEADFFDLCSDEIRRSIEEGVFPYKTTQAKLITRRGYLKITKSLNDDTAWDVFDQMIERYFAAERLPQITHVEALRMLADTIEERDRAIATKAEIGSRREATAMATASAATRKANALECQLDQSMEYATVKRMNALYGGNFAWRPLKKESEKLGLPPKSVHDANYGSVKAYHADVWREAYELEIPRAH